MDACIWIAPTWRVVWRRSIARVAQLPQPRLDDLERLRAAKTTGVKADLSERRRALTSCMSPSRVRTALIPPHLQNQRNPQQSVATMDGGGSLY